MPPPSVAAVPAREPLSPPSMPNGPTSPHSAASSSSSGAATAAAASPPPQDRRPLAPNERSYFLPSRAHGVNDMYLHHHLHAPNSAVTRARLTAAWATLRVRHPLLAARVERDGQGFDCFVYDRPRTAGEALDGARATLTFDDGAEGDGDRPTGEDRIRTYLNGPRTLAHHAALAQLVVGRSPAPAVSATTNGITTANDDGAAPEEEEWDVLLLAAHFAADGLALHASADELYGLAFGPTSAGTSGGGGGGGGMKSVEEVERLLAREVERVNEAHAPGLPKSADERLADAVNGARPSGTSTAASSSADEASKAERPFDARRAWKRAVGRVLFERAVARGVGGQTLTRLPHSSASSTTTTTRVSTLALSPADSHAVVRAAKANGVGVAQAVVGALSVGWASVKGAALVKEEPALFYSAMSIRPLLAPASPSTAKPEPNGIANDRPSAPPSAVHLALGYYTLSLPAFLVPSPTSNGRSSSSPSTSPTSSLATTLWLRAHAVKRQTASATSRGWQTGARVLAELEVRGERAGEWARRDDEAAAAAAAAAGGGVGLGLGVVMRQGTVERVGVDDGNTNGQRQDVVVGPLSPPPTPAVPAPAPTPTTAANVPLLGLSLLGNLDGVYTSLTSYPSVRLSRLTTGSRQRPSAALLFVYSFGARLCVSMGWETGGLGGAESEVGRWFAEVERVVEDVLVGRALEGADRFVL